jgi:molybdopterin/thiamine biosynthesis adenylyltransferase
MSYREEYLNRSIPILTAPGIRHLEQTTLAVAGCGGVGGAYATLMARMGVTGFRLADPGIFDEPDINRQWGANRHTLGINKCEVYREQLDSINPAICSELFTDGVTPQNVTAFLGDSEVLLDCLDVSVDISLRSQLYTAARERNMYIITAPVLAFGCVIACSHPQGASMELFLKMYEGSQDASGAGGSPLSHIFMPKHLSLVLDSVAKGKVPSIAIAPTFAASLAATESLQFLLQDILPDAREPLSLPNVLLFDLFRMSYMLIDASILT